MATERLSITIFNTSVIDAGIASFDYCFPWVNAKEDTAVKPLALIKAGYIIKLFIEKNQCKIPGHP